MLEIGFDDSESEKDIEHLLDEAEKQSALAQEEPDPTVKADMLEKALIVLRDTVSPMVRLKVKPVLDELMESIEKEATDAVDRLWKMRHENNRDETKQVTLFYPHGESSKFRIGSPVVVKYDNDELYITTGHVLSFEVCTYFECAETRKNLRKASRMTRVEYVVFYCASYSIITHYS